MTSAALSRSTSLRPRWYWPHLAHQFDVDEKETATERLGRLSLGIGYRTDLDDWSNMTPFACAACSFITASLARLG